MKRFWLSVGVMLTLLSFSQATVPTLQFDGSKTEIEGKYIGVLEDASGQLSVEDVIKRDDFTASEQKVPNLMITESSFWARIEVTNQTDDGHLFLEYAYPIVDQADVYVVNQDGSYTVQVLGETTPISERKYKHPNFIYDLKIAQNETKTVLMNIRNGQQIMLPLNIGTKDAVFNNITEKDILSGIYLGIVLVMSLYNLFIFFTTRDRSYLYYVAYILLVGLTHISHHGYTYKLLWPSSALLASWSVALSPALVGFAGIFFIRNFLHTKVYAKWMHYKFYGGLMVAYTACIILFFTGQVQISYQLSQASAMVLALSILGTALHVLRKGYRPAKFFVVAWSVFLISVTIFILKDFGVLPYTTLTTYCLEIGSSIEMVLLSFALADRINILKSEKEAYQAKTLEALKENERLMREQNVMLEEKVEERTSELQKTNGELNVALTDLKEAQTQLVSAEKMASLGVLTAGIAHEINNPINFVVANINPLKRDVQDILEILNKYDEIQGSEGLQDKLKEIKELKEELDINYLLEEIDMLLKGIDDGASRTAEIVKSLKTFSRLDESDLKKADINECLDSTLVLLNSSFTSNIEIVKNYSKLDSIECYAGKLNQLFMNVLNNAIHAVEEKQFENGEQPVITIGSKDTPEHVVISIKDNGIGMDGPTMSKIFEPFFTTKDVGKGTGLGMSIAYNIIEKHNGTIKVQSEPGVGTEIIISVPKHQQVTDVDAREERIKELKEERRDRLTKGNNVIR